MAVDLAFIESPSPGANNWVWLPSGDDTKDADNFQYILDGAQAINISDQLTASLTVDDGTFYLRKEVEIADLHMTMESFSGNAILQLGTLAGGPMDLLTVAKALEFNEALIPSGLVLYNKLGGLGTDFTMRGIQMKTPASTNARVGTQWILADISTQTGPAPWDNANVNGMIHRAGLIESVKTGITVSISAPDGADKQTLVVFTAKFVVGDVGKPITIFDSPQAANDGLFVISDFVDAFTVKYVHATGVLDAVGNSRWASILNPLPIARSSVRFEECEFEGDLGDPVGLYGGTAIASVDTALLLADFQPSVSEGTATPPTNSAEAGWETQFAVVDDGGGDRYFWHNFSTRVVNGDIVIRDCTFKRVGLAYAVEQWPEIDIGVAITQPTGAARPTSDTQNNTFTECGFVPWGGSYAGVVHVNMVGDTELSANIFETPTVSQDPLNGLAGIALTHGALSLIDPAAETLMGATLLPTDIGADLATLKMDGNDIDTGIGAAGESTWAGIVIRGQVTGVGDPLDDALWQRAVVARNRIRGDCVQPLRLRGQNGIDVFGNDMEGRDDFETVRVIGCVDVHLRENKMHKRPPFSIVFEESVKASSITDGAVTTPQGLRAIVLGGGTNVLTGVKVTTDPVSLPTDPGASRPIAPV